MIPQNCGSYLVDTPLPQKYESCHLQHVRRGGRQLFLYIYIIYIYYYYMRHMYIYYIYLVNPNPNFSSGINKTIPRVFHEFEKYLGYGRKTSGLSSVSSSILLRPSFVPQVLVHYRTEPFCISLPPLFEIYLCPNPLHSLVTQFFMIFVSKSSGFSKTHTKPVLINP